MLAINIKLLALHGVRLVLKQRKFQEKRTQTSVQGSIKVMTNIMTNSMSLTIHQPKHPLQISAEGRQYVWLPSQYTSGPQHLPERAVASDFQCLSYDR